MSHANLEVLVALVVLVVLERRSIILQEKHRHNVSTSVPDEPTNRSLWVLIIQTKIPEISVICQMEQSFIGKTEALPIFRSERNLTFTDVSVSRLFRIES